MVGANGNEKILLVPRSLQLSDKKPFAALLLQTLFGRKDVVVGRQRKELVTDLLLLHSRAARYVRHSRRSRIMA
jgi:hypothetical protein